ncbi:hypothetical protein PAXRUDRAFT_827682 [Paxillus rubicundulus Ve08.2h10]|uniref:Uncharacterized protein n=1 Tax=Paxillus rubicundulus Ve08.2h10 TaxID=930991 RepID=A0A0D0DQL0_9AGAM|nr:hypothetical protein PAXRUDRAFT_827682 [Paxillus rubicundulus Ve08.2h10]
MAAWLKANIMKALHRTDGASPVTMVNSSRQIIPSSLYECYELVAADTPTPESSSAAHM